ncbi:hypothetical protein HYZ70_01925 [Candidatus Curtissbacteria bacterium]|nr:hypothetical protein [Candidatus Curtissbacteria bacterium]
MTPEGNPSNINKWDLRRRKASDVSVDSTGKMEGANWDLVKQWQIEFQNEFCPSCINFDPKTNTFKEKGRANNPDDCKYHWTDIVGQCWNYRNREEVEEQQAAFEALPQTEESPFIVLPDDKTRIQQLRTKLKEYKNRLDPYKAPELQMNTLCKIEVLSELLAQGRVETWDFSRKLADKYGTGFSTMGFQAACAVIDDYCKTGGKNLQGGTGLPGVSS